MVGRELVGVHDEPSLVPGAVVAGKGRQGQREGGKKEV
jgi:hypothetical protein